MGEAGIGLPTGKATISISRTHDPAFEAGRRSTLTNRDLKASDATGGRMLAIVSSATEGMGLPSGWHYHPNDYQLLLVQRGWFDIEIEDGTRTRIEERDSLLLLGYVRHGVG